MSNLGKYVNIKTGKLDANASSPNGKYPFLHVQKSLCKYPHIVTIVNAFL